jgi:hypothetical protein
MAAAMQPFCSHAAQPFTPQKTKAPDFQGFLEADDGTRTHDLLHGKAWRAFAPVRVRSLNLLFSSSFASSERTAANPSERRVQPLQPL